MGGRVNIVEDAVDKPYFDLNRVVAGSNPAADFGLCNSVWLECYVGLSLVAPSNNFRLP